MSLPEMRLGEAKKLGFTRCLIPDRNKARLSDDGGLELVPVGTLTQALEVLG